MKCKTNALNAENKVLQRTTYVHSQQQRNLIFDEIYFAYWRNALILQKAEYMYLRKRSLWFLHKVVIQLHLKLFPVEIV